MGEAHDRVLKYILWSIDNLIKTVTQLLLSATNEQQYGLFNQLGGFFENMRAMPTYCGHVS